MIYLPEMIVPKAMFHTPLKLSYVPATILAGVNTTSMALPARPLSRIQISCVEPVDTESMPETLPVLSPVPATPSPRLHAVTVVLLVDPVSFVSPTHVIVVYAAPGALAPVKLTLVHVPIAVNLDPGP